MRLAERMIEKSHGTEVTSLDVIILQISAENLFNFFLHLNKAKDEKEEEEEKNKCNFPGLGQYNLK